MHAERDSLLKLFVPAMIGLAAGALVAYSMTSMEFKWTIFIVVALGAVSFGVFLGSTTDRLKNVLLFCAVLSLPIFYSNTFMYVKETPFVVLANGFPITLFNAFMIPLLLLWGYELLFDPNCPPVRLPQGWLLPLTLLFLINLVSSVLAPVPFYSYSMLFLQLKSYLVLLYFANTVRDVQTIRLIGFACAGILIMQGLIVLEQWLVGVIFTAENLGRGTVVLKSRIGAGYISRMAGTLSHPNALAMYLNLTLPWVAFLFLVEKRALRRTLLMIAIALALIALILSGSRGAWLGLAITITVSFFLWMRKQGKNPLVGLGVSAFSLLLLFSVLFAASSTFRGRLVEGDAGAALVRIPLMEVAKEMILANPVTGVGLNHYTREMARYDHTAIRIATRYNQSVHNTWMLMAAETGVPSLIIFVYLFFILFLREAYRVFQNNQGMLSALGIGVFGMLIAWAVHNQVNLTAPYDDTTIWVLIGLLAAASRLTGRSLLPQARTQPFQPKFHA